MQVNFKFALGDKVKIVDLGNIPAIVRSASYGRGQVIGYWVDAVDTTFRVQELFVEEANLA